MIIACQFAASRSILPAMRVRFLILLLSQAILVAAGETRPFVQAWNVADFDDVISVGLEGHRDYANGRRMFTAASCSTCHQIHGEGGASGPDLTGVREKFSPRDLLEAILNPGKEILQPYGRTAFEMKGDSVVSGRIIETSTETILVMADMMHPDKITTLARSGIRSMKNSSLSMMPSGLANTLSREDVLDLLAYLLSAGNEKDPLFAR
jgi:putative heme-binding domain-containing protein